MDIDYLESLLNSNSIHSHAKAAVSLRFRMVDGVHLLPSLLKVCKAVETPLRKDLTRPEKYLLGFGAMTMGEFIGNKGYCEANPLHPQIVHWVIELTRSLNTEVAFYAINAIRLCNTPLHEATDRLVKMIEMEKRDDDMRLYRFGPMHFARFILLTQACQNSLSITQHGMS